MLRSRLLLNLCKMRQGRGDASLTKRKTIGGRGAATRPYSTMNMNEDYIRVGAFDPDNPQKEPSETVTITFMTKKQKYHILIHSPEGVDELIRLLADAKEEAWTSEEDI